MSRRVRGVVAVTGAVVVAGVAGCGQHDRQGAGDAAGAVPAAGDVVALPDGMDLWVQSGIRCQILSPQSSVVGCESSGPEFAQAPILPYGPRANGVKGGADGSFEWLSGNLGIPLTEVVLEPGRTYRTEGWTIRADSAGAGFTNDGTGNGIYVSIDDVHVLRGGAGP